MKKKGEVNTTAYLIFFIVILTLGIATIDYVSDTAQDIDTTSVSPTITTTNESDLNGGLAFVNQTGYTLANVNGSNSGYTATAIWVDWNQSQPQQYVYSPWNFSASPLSDNVNFSISGQSSSSTDVKFNGTGTKMYVLDTGSDSILQYTLSTPWDVSTASWDGNTTNFSVATQESGATGIFFNNTGTAMYMVGTATARIYEYTLAQPWNVSNATYNNQNKSAASGSLNGIFFNSSGEKMYIVSAAGTVYQYTLNPPWNISNSSYDSILFAANQDSATTGVFFNSTGTKMFTIGRTNDRVYQYTLSQAWNLSTASNDNVNFSISSQDGTPEGFSFNTTGEKMYIVGASNDRVYQYSLNQSLGLHTPTGYNVSVAAANYSLSGAGVLTNATTYTFPNVSVSYTNTYTTVETQSSSSTSVLRITSIFIALSLLIFLGFVIFQNLRRS